MMYEVGKRYPEFISRQDNPRCGFADNELIVTVSLGHITSHELEQFQSETQFEIRYVILNKLCFFLLKFGDMEWMDVPFSPCIGKSFALQNVKPNQGYACTVMVFERTTGELKHQRLIGLGELFSRDLQRDLEELKEKGMSVEEYMSNLMVVQSTYSTKELVRMAGVRNRFRL